MRAIALALMLLSGLASAQVAGVCKAGSWCRVWKLTTTGTASLGSACLVSSPTANTLGCATSLGTNVNISAGANSILAWDQGFIRMGVGSAATPQVYFAGDTNTGLYWAAADTMSFTTGGVARMSIGATGVTTFSGPVSMPTNNLFSMGSSSFYERASGIIATGNNLQWTGAAFGSFTAAATAGAGAVQYDTTNSVLRMSNATAWLTVAHEVVIDGYHPAAIATSAARLITGTQARNPGKAVNIYVTQMVAGVNAAVYTVQLYNSTQAASLCSVTLSCAAGVGSGNSNTSCTGAIAKNDIIRIEADTTPCATSPGFNVSASIIGG